MANAVGMVEVLGLPPALAAADAMCKAANVTLVGMEKVSGARYTVIVRGDVAETTTAVEAGVEAAKRIVRRQAALLVFARDCSPQRKLRMGAEVDATQREAC
jgi:carbon dioxide concentrating mechanism protein CcmK